jgi:hypothetical protein
MPASPNGDGRTVIAHYRKGKAAGQALAIAALMGVCYVVTLYYPHGSIVDGLKARHALLSFAIFFWIVGAFALFFCFTVLRLVLFCRARALWVEGAAFVYLSRIFFSVRCEDVVEVASGVFERSGKPCIHFRMRNGSRKAVPTLPLAEPAAVIVDRLNAHRGDRHAAPAPQTDEIPE